MVQNNRCTQHLYYKSSTTALQIALPWLCQSRVFSVGCSYSMWLLYQTALLCMIFLLLHPPSVCSNQGQEHKQDDVNTQNQVNQLNSSSNLSDFLSTSFIWMNAFAASELHVQVAVQEPWFRVDLQSESHHLQPSVLVCHLQLFEGPFFG